MDYNKYKTFVDKLNNGDLFECLLLGEALAELTLEEDRRSSDYASLLYNLGGLNMLFSRFSEASDRYLSAAETFTSHGSRKETYNAFTNAGAAFAENNNVEKAVDCFNRALRIYQESFGEKHPLTAVAYYNLGSAYRDTQPLLAREAFVTASNCTELTVSDRFDVLYSLALTYENEDIKAAISVYIKTLNAQRETFGGNNPEYIGNLYYLGLMYERDKNYIYASRSIAKAIALTTDLSRTHNKLFEMNIKLSEIYECLRKTDKAIVAKEKGIRIFTARNGENHISLCAVLHSLAVLYKTSDSHKSLQLQYRILRITQRLFGADSLPYIREVMSVCLFCAELRTPPDIPRKLITQTVTKLRKAKPQKPELSRILSLLTSITLEGHQNDLLSGITPILMLLKELYGN